MKTKDECNKRHAGAASIRERAMACTDADTRREMLATADGIIDDLYAPPKTAREAREAANAR